MFIVDGSMVNVLAANRLVVVHNKAMKIAALFAALCFISRVVPRERSFIVEELGASTPAPPSPSRCRCSRCPLYILTFLLHLLSSGDRRWHHVSPSRVVALSV